jgi:heme exporter protein B
MNPRLIYHLLRKDIILEIRQKYALNGIILYVFSTLFIIQLSFTRMEPMAWITLFWIVILFASVNAGAKSFIQEGKSRQLYYYTISSPEDIIISKFLYNCILLTILGLLNLLGFMVFFGNVIQNIPYFLLILLLGSTGFAANFTMVSAISSKAKGSATLMSILSFPIIIPQLLLLIRMTKRAMDGMEIYAGRKDLLGLLALNMIIVIVSYMLFPYLWRE